MSLAMKARQKVKRKGGAVKDRVFGCDLVEHLQLSGQDVPQVLKSCTEFVEQHGIVDGIYRLSGVSSNIQKLRLEFDTDRSPDLSKDVYLQDIHCVSSLCKAYFRELPNPLLTYQLYDKFADAVAIQLEEDRLVKIKQVLKELPAPHYRTLEFLMRHLVRMASHSSDTNMHVRNLAIVWAPNLLRSKDIEVCGFNGTAAFMEVRIQSIVVEFILTHVEQLFGDAPLCAGSRESLRKSLLLMGSPVALADDKYCFSYNVPAVLNQGDGPPQMRPYHTIIELTDSKRKGSLKAKKWRSIFNLGRSSQDSKRKSNKLDDKDGKPSKMRLRPAKSMDSLSSLPCTPDDDVRLGRERPQKQLTLCRESFDGPASLDSSFLESDEYPDKNKEEERQGDSEGEATAKSEPTTPKAGRSSLVGAAPAGRSPKAARSRAEKCAGVHISGPFSVTVPFHITSNLTLSRLTRGLECPALSHCSLDQETPESSEAKEEEAAQQVQPRLAPMATADEEEPTADASVGCLLEAEEQQLSMEVQDSFSFLDSQDTWLGDSLDGDPPRKNSHVAQDFAGGGADGCSSLEDDMNEIIGDSMQMEMFPAVPPLDYLSIEECMNEHSEDEDGQYYLAAGFLDSDELSKEADSEDVYLSAFDDLSPLATELQHLQEFGNPPRGANPPEPFSLAVETSAGDPADIRRETLVDGLPPHDPEPAASSQDPECAKVAEEEGGASLNSRSHLRQMGPVLNVEAKAAETQPSLLPGEGGGDDFRVQMGHLLQDGCLRGTLEEFYKRSLAPEHEKWATQPNLEDEQERQVWSASETEQAEPPPCAPSAEAEGSTRKAGGTTEEHAAFGFPVEEAEQMQNEMGARQPLPAEASLSLEDLTLLEAELQVDDGSEDASLKRFPMPVPSPEPPVWPGAASPDVPLPNHCVECDGLTLTGSSPKNCPANLPQNPEHAPPASAHDLSDGSVHMTLTSSTIRVQQVKSFPVVPPKPQFAKLPPSLAPRSPTREASPTWPNLPGPTKNCGDGVKDVPHGGSVQSFPACTSLDTFGGATDDKDVESLPTPSKMPTSPENGCGDSRTLQKQRNSMPVSLENYSRAETIAQPWHPSLNQCSLWSRSSDLSGDGLQHVPGSWAEGGEGETPRKKPPVPAWLDHHSGEGSRQKPRWTTWRNGASMSFDEAVALAKERHVAPMRRMQTYSYGDAEGLPGPPGTEKLAVQPESAPRPLGPLSCTSSFAAPEALSTTTGKPPERPRLPGQEGLPFPQDLVPRSLPRLGRHLSFSEEASGAASQEWR